MNAKKLLLSLVAGLLAAGAVSAQTTPKIAVVDLKKIFEGYYKTKQADAQLKERGADAEKVLKGYMDDYTKANEDYRKLIDSSNDQAVSTEEREKRKKSAETKFVEIKEIEDSVKKFRSETTVRLEEQKRRMRENILREIRDVVNAKARAGNYTMVLDAAAESINQTPVLVFSSGQNDLTEDVIAEVNAGASPSALSPKEPAPAAPKPADGGKKDEKK